ncbi:hypothetical protein [Listeria booriae]|uniref:hypothetical protein n=1 Tax=Listeria booriae TaxID=1552123 RepID=UPI001629A2EA|nr:hypothetical protein [Listeria booriae]MBC1272694.1 hypothetical protein [Listeria booriae]
MTKIMQMTQKNSEGVVESFFPVSHSEAITNFQEAVKAAMAANSEMVTVAEKTAWNAKETPAGAQAKADAAKAAANAYTDAYFASKNVWNGATYFLGTHTFSWNAADMKLGVFVEVQRYTPGTGPLGYGYFEFFIPRNFILRNPAKAIWLCMPGADGTRKTIRCTSTTIQGDDTNGDSPANAYCVSNVAII